MDYGKYNLSESEKEVLREYDYDGILEVLLESFKEDERESFLIELASGLIQFKDKIK